MIAHTTFPTVIDLDHVQALGNVDESLASFYGGSVAAAATDAVSEREIRDWIEYDLISEQGFRSQVLEGPGLAGPAVLLGLENAYLIRSDMRRGAQWFELSHDRLVGPVRASNAAWRKANLSALQVSSMAWDRQGRPDALLAAGAALTDAATWAETNPHALLAADEEFLTASEAHEHGLLAAKKASRRNRMLAGVAATLALLAIIGGAVAYNANENSKDLRAARIEADRQRESAVESADVAEQSAEQATASEAEALQQRGVAEESATQAREQQQLAEESSEEAASARRSAEDSEEEALVQQQLAEDSAAEAEVQRKLAEDNAAEAERQRGIAENNAANARTQQQRAEDNAAEAERQRRIAQANEAVAIKQTNAAQASEALANALTREAEEKAECVSKLTFAFSNDLGDRIINGLGQDDDSELRAYAEFLQGSIPASFDPAINC